MTNMGKAIGFCWLLINVYVLFSLTWTKKIEKHPVMSCEECKNFKNELCRQGAIDKLKEIEFLDANTPEIYLLKQQNIILEAQIYYSECYKLLVEDSCNDLCKGQNK